MAHVRNRKEENDWKKRKSNNKDERCNEENYMEIGGPKRGLLNLKGKTLQDHNFNKIEDDMEQSEESWFKSTSDEDENDNTEDDVEILQKSRSLFESTTDEEDGNFGYKSTGDEEESNSAVESITDEERSNSEGEFTSDEERSNSEGESTSDEEESDERESGEESVSKMARYRYTQPTIKKGFIRMWIKPAPKITRKNKKKHRSRKSKRGAKETATPNRKDKKGHKSCSSKKDVKETVKLVVPRPKTPEPPNLRSRKCGMLIKRDFTVSNEWTVMYLLWSENFGCYMQEEEFKREFVVSAKYRSINMLYYDSDRLQYEFWVVDMTPRMLKLIREKRYTLCRRGRDSIIAFDYITNGDWLGSEWHKVE